MADKPLFRAAWKAREREFPAEVRRQSDAQLQARFLALPELETAQTVLLFWSMNYEVDTVPLIDTLSAEGKTVLLPRCLPKGELEIRAYRPQRLVRHRYGMQEPDEGCAVADKTEVDLALIPALCYDSACYRMGRGGGYYDRFLKDFGGITVGLCRETLLCDKLPRESWDCPVDFVLTEQNTYRRK